MCHKPQNQNIPAYHEPQAFSSLPAIVQETLKQSGVHKQSDEQLLQCSEHFTNALNLCSTGFVPVLFCFGKSLPRACLKLLSRQFFCPAPKNPKTPLGGVALVCRQFVNF